jgi:hypothetical protein
MLVLIQRRSRQQALPTAMQQTQSLSGANLRPTLQRTGANRVTMGLQRRYAVQIHSTDTTRA